MARIFDNAVVIWLGVISYGLYLFHPFVPPIYVHLLDLFSLPAETWGVYYIRYPMLLLLLLGITSASFYLWEQPIRRYRKYFA